jgi:hypothetical protein
MRDFRPLEAVGITRSRPRPKTNQKRGNSPRLFCLRGFGRPSNARLPLFGRNPPEENPRDILTTNFTGSSQSIVLSLQQIMAGSVEVLSIR